MDRGKYMTTGEVASVMHVTKNTLFHYDKIGLFSPEAKLDNDYRCYGTQQLELLDAILWLRELDMPLEEIREFLTGRTPEKLLKLFEVEDALADRQLKRLKDRREWMREKRARVESVLSLDLSGVCRKAFPRRFYIIDEVDGDSAREFAAGVTRLMGVYGKSNDSICYEIGYLQSGEDIRRGVYDNYRNVALLTAKKPKGLAVHSLEAGEYLTAYHVGHWTGIGTAYGRLLSCAKREGIKLEGWFVESGVIDNLATEREEEFVTEISVRCLNP